MRVHILDFNAGQPNRGTAALLALAGAWGEAFVYDVRGAGELPEGLDGVWILGGGPGSPLEPGAWREPLLAALRARVDGRRPTLAICYGFELLCLAMGARLDRLTTVRVGVWPVRLTPSGAVDPTLGGLDGRGSFENRSWGVWMEEEPAAVLARGDADDVTAARWGAEIVGTIFHPEAGGEAVAEVLAGALGAEVDGHYGVGTALRMAGLDVNTVYGAVVPRFLRATIGAPVRVPGDRPDETQMGTGPWDDEPR